MRIGIDIDGVLTDVYRWQIDYGSKYYYLKNNKNIVNPNGFHTSDMYDVKDVDDHLYWDELFIDYSKNIPCRPFAGEVIEKLKNMGMEIYIITSRGYYITKIEHKLSEEENENLIKEWLSKNNIKYDKLLITGENKLNEVLESKIEVMIEDHPKNILKFSKYIKVLAYTAPYNEYINGENIEHVYSWYDILYHMENKYIDSNVIHDVHLHDEPFNKIKCGTKTIELRLYDEKRRKYKIGDIIRFINRLTNEELMVRINSFTICKSFDEIFKMYNKVLFGYDDSSNALIDDMLKYYTKEDIDKYGVVGIHISLL